MIIISIKILSADHSNRYDVWIQVIEDLSSTKNEHKAAAILAEGLQIMTSTMERGE